MPLFDTGTVEIGEDKIEIRELSVPQLREADQAGTEAMVRLMSLLPEKVVSDVMDKQRAQAVERIVRFEGYDPEVLLRYGITGWSFDEECTVETRVNSLGAKKGEQIARAIFELSVLDEVKVVTSSTEPSEAKSLPGEHEDSSS